MVQGITVSLYLSLCFHSLGNEHVMGDVTIARVDQRSPISNESVRLVELNYTSDGVYKIKNRICSMFVPLVLHEMKGLHKYQYAVK